MKKVFLAAMVVAICVALVAPAFAGGIAVRQSQSQVVVQGQASLGGFSVSSQGYSSGARQGYAINKAPTFLSPSSGAAAGGTANFTSGSQIRYGSGVNVQGMLGGSTNNGGMIW